MASEFVPSYCGLALCAFARPEQHVATNKIRKTRNVDIAWESFMRRSRGHPDAFEADALYSPPPSSPATREEKTFTLAILRAPISTFLALFMPEAGITGPISTRPNSASRGCSSACRRHTQLPFAPLRCFPPRPAEAQTQLSRLCQGLDSVYAD